MTQVLFTAFSDRADAVSLAHHAHNTLSSLGVTSSVQLLDEPLAAGIDEETLIVSLGGEVTFLRSARLAHSVNARVVAVNLGRLGFLLDVAPADVAHTVRNALQNDDSVGRLALEIQLLSGETFFAFNEVVVEREAPGHMVRVTTYIDDDEFFTYSADGVMVSTPTGSTGYSFSAGGPMIEADLPVMAITPVAPHFTIDRSLVVSERRTIRLQAGGKPAVVVADSHVIGTLQPDESVLVRRSPTPVRVVRTGSFDMGMRLRASLREGHA